MAGNGIGYSMLEMTTVFLIIVFVAAEFYRYGNRITGMVRKVLPLDGDPTGLAGVRLRVETSEAGEVTALVSGCQMCLSPIKMGETVSLVPGPNGYIVKPPWISAQRHDSHCCRGSVGVSPARIENGHCVDSQRVAGETPALPGKKTP
jgi:hypothetical protein